MRVLVGTSGFSYPAWRGSFYPEKLPEAKMLGHYADPAGCGRDQQHLLPDAHARDAGALGGRDARRPFGSRSRARGASPTTAGWPTSPSAVERLDQAARALGDKLGPILFQLPPNMKKDLVRLDDFLAALPPGLRPGDGVSPRLVVRGRRVCLPARPQARRSASRSRRSWRRRPSRPRRGATCASGGRTTTTPPCDAWAERIRGQSWETAYVFFKHEDEAKGPDFAATFTNICGETALG